jgi:hypothetical protein
VLDAEDPVQILAPDPHERAAFLGRRDRELIVELGNLAGP